MNNSVQLNELFDILAYEFKDIHLIITALTHSSYANEAGGRYHIMNALNSWAIQCWD